MSRGAKVRYDNLKAAVAQVLGLSRARVETDRWIAFRSHFGIESFYCRPGIDGAHEKGGVEGMIGYFRRNHFTPVPEVSSLAELNEMVEQWDRHDGRRRIGSRPRTIDEYFAVEQPLLMPLPEEPFETGPAVHPAGRPLRPDHRPHQPLLGPDPADRQAGPRRAARLSPGGLRPERGSRPARTADRQGRRRLDLDHYLEALIRKPGAFPGATALEQARSAGKFTPVHDAWWDQARKIHGERDGTRALIEVLLLGRHLPHEHVVAGLATALRAGALTADAVALEARKAAQAEDRTRPRSTAGLREAAGDGDVPARVAACAPSADTRPLPSVTPYDQLLRRRRASGGDHREEKHSDPAPPARLDRAGRRRRHRHRLPHAAAAVDPQRVLRHRRSGDEGPDDLPRLPRRATDGRVRRPVPPPLGTADQGGGLPAELPVMRPSHEPLPTSRCLAGWLLRRARARA